MHIDYLRRPVVILFFIYVSLIIFLEPFFIKKPEQEKVNKSFFCGKVISYSNKRHKGFSFILNDKNHSYIVTSNMMMDFALYDYICVYGEAEEIDNFYKNYYRRKNIFYEIKAKDIKIIKKSNFIFRLSASIRKKVKEIIAENFKHDEYSIISGIFLGEKEELRNDLKNAIIGAGVMHLLVASGSNISYIVLLVANFFWFLRRGSVSMALFSIIFAFIYAVMIGLDPPITRAFLMLLFVFISHLLERNTDIIQILFLTAFIMILFNPILVYDISFIMSFVSVYGIILGYENFGKYLYINKVDFIKNKNRFFEKLEKAIRYFLNFVISLIVVTFFAQISLMPVLLSFFYKVSLVSFISNIVLIPISFSIMIITVVFIVLHLLFNNSFFIFYFLAFLSDLFIKFCFWFSSFKYSLVYLFYPNKITLISSVFIIFLLLNFSLLKDFYIIRGFFYVCVIIFIISLGWVKRSDGVFSFSSNKVNGYLVLKNGKSYLINPVIHPDKIYGFLFSHGYSKIDFIFVTSYKGYRKNIINDISSRFNLHVYFPLWFGFGNGIFGGDRIDIFDVRFDDIYGYFNKYSELVLCDGNICYK